MAASIINTDFIRKHRAQAVLTVLGLGGGGAHLSAFPRALLAASLAR